MDFSGILSAIGGFIGKVMESAKSATRKVLRTSYGFQLRARLMPYSTCFSHSVANLLSSVGIMVSPDEVTQTVNSQEYQQWVRQNVNWAVAYFGRLQTVWQVQERFLNQQLQKAGLAGKYKVVMNWATTRESINESIQAGFPVVIDTYPMYYKTNTQIGHIVAIVGYAFGYAPNATDFPSVELLEAYQKKFGNGARDCYVVDDPFGNMLDQYRGNEDTQPIVGDDLIIPVEWFDSGVRGKFSLTLQEKVG